MNTLRTLSAPRTVLRAALLAVLLAAGPVRADGVEILRQFMRDTPGGKGAFTQTVTAADGVRKKVSAGTFEFQRPNRFRFVYAKPFEQWIVADGSKVWIYDPDLKQASSRRLDAALDGTPAALLAGGSLDKDFVLKDEAPRDGLVRVLATPKGPDGTVRELRVGLRGKDPASIEILDNFGQRSVLEFSGFQAVMAPNPEAFRFKPPPGVDVIEQ